MSRTRTRVHGIATGDVVITARRPGWGQPLGYFGSHTSQCTDRCEDTVHPHPFVAESPLRLYKENVQYARLTGTYKNPNNHWKATSLPLRGKLIVTNGIERDLADQLKEATVAAETYRQAPTMDLPLTLAELKDLPRTVRTFKRIMARQASGSDVVLSWNYGISPLASDVRKLFNLQRLMAERFRQISNAIKRGRVEGTLSSVPGSSRPILHEGIQALPGILYQGVREEVVSSHGKAWWSARVEPNGWDLSDRSDLLDPVANLGLDRARVSTVYNLIPWSFLVDYFTNVGDLVSAASNKYSWNVGKICIMNQLEVKTRITWFSDYRTRTLHDVKYSEGHGLYTYKWRDVGTPYRALRFTPMLSFRQAANVFALASSRIRRS